jgi:DNA-binding response OmpR family regulator
MIPRPKRILVVEHDHPLRGTRVILLKSKGYAVESVETDDQAMELLQIERFDLILLGRRSQLPTKDLDQRIREKFPELFILKIEEKGEIASVYSSRTTDSAPEHVVAALKEMLSPEIAPRNEK